MFCITGIGRSATTPYVSESEPNIYLLTCCFLCSLQWFAPIMLQHVFGELLLLRGVICDQPHSLNLTDRVPSNKVWCHLARTAMNRSVLMACHVTEGNDRMSSAAVVQLMHVTTSLVHLVATKSAFFLLPNFALWEAKHKLVQNLFNISHKQHILITYNSFISVPFL